eukprot:COSAG02_NODE_67516_length_252_cov_7.183007_1_plen_25_part_01
MAAARARSSLKAERVHGACGKVHRA